MRERDVQEGSVEQCLLQEQGGLLITSFAITDIIGAIAIFSMKKKIIDHCSFALITKFKLRRSLHHRLLKSIFNS